MWGVGCCCQYISKHVLPITRTSSMCSKTPKCLLPPLHPDRFFPPPPLPTVTSATPAWDSECKEGVTLYLGSKSVAVFPTSRH